jgi:hypothetical protein
VIFTRKTGLSLISSLSIAVISSYYFFSSIKAFSLIYLAVEVSYISSLLSRVDFVGVSSVRFSGYSEIRLSSGRFSRVFWEGFIPLRLRLRYLAAPDIIIL